MTTVAPALQNERNKSQFDTSEMTYYLDGGREITEQRRHISKIYLLK